ncbi:MAG: hypothetical protein JJU35_12120 [Balneolales bacterium]|nr:hypothetical protein [Balneolales bacterium]
MHFEILVEDQSGKKALEILVPKIIGSGHSVKIISYKGIGRLPKDLNSSGNAMNRALLNQLPKLLRGYGQTYPSAGEFKVAVIVVCDLDDKCLSAFRKELLALLNSCNPRPLTRFCIAVEEGEAWLLGDLNAVNQAYPHAKDAVLRKYVNDSICGTWELLADALYKGGASALKKRGWQAVGSEKSKWAEEICPLMDVSRNASPSFNYLREKLNGLITDNN